MKKHILFSFFIALLGTSCDSYLDVKPKDRVIPETLGDYRNLLTSGYQSFPKTKAKASVRTDEMSINPDDFSAPNYKDIFLWKDTGYDPETTEFDYDLLYRTIFYANEVISGVASINGDQSIKNQLVGEAHALRAYAYFELVNLFSKPYEAASARTERGVPLILEIDMENYTAPASLEQIYTQIASDIRESENLMNIAVQPDAVKYRFSKLSLEAFKSRFYLYKKDYANALEAVNKVLAQNGNLLDLNANTQNILPNNIASGENIQALDYAVDNVVNRMAIVSPELIALYDAANDLRFPLYYTLDGNSYKTEKGSSQSDMCSFRTGELLLAKAEILYRAGDENQAKTTLLQLAEKRYNATGFAAYTATVNALSGNAFLEELMNERFRETAFEGYRWFDLRRNDQKQITHTYNGITEVLQTADPRYTIAFPRSAQQQNPALAE
ncbi:MAG: RagB/SusD family nutrient uptake outer membrane protein [Capnocytophaga sp.]|nr:RagB/SusD family nutrient uptake outer membrane protein [Capnocytophaga sp.]